MSDYKTIKDLVIQVCITDGSFPSYERLTALVIQHFPTSKWQKTHYSWYKSKIKNGEIFIPGISNEKALEDDITNIAIEEAFEASISLERDLHVYLATRLHEIELGLILVDNGVEYQTEAGNIDLLARDQSNTLVVLELKVDKAKDSALGQLLGYIGYLSTSTNNMVRGILIASSFDARVVYAARGLSHIKLVKYQVSFEFQEIT